MNQMVKVRPDEPNNTMTLTIATDIGKHELYEWHEYLVVFRWRLDYVGLTGLVISKAITMVKSVTSVVAHAYCFCF